MKILMVNKFLYPNGGSETYVFKLGKKLAELGHEVQYFGMEHPGRVVGNRAGSYTSPMDFHTGKMQKLLYPFKIIYSLEARKKIRKVLEDFRPDAVHLNNFNFQLTPSIIYEIQAYKGKSGKRVPLVYTAHDSQLVCPNHLLMIPSPGGLCRKCIDGKAGNCTRYKCIHGSFIKSLLGTVEACVYRILKTYQYIDTIICPSEFMKETLSHNPILAGKMLVLHNFVDEAMESMPLPHERGDLPEDYVLYFGRYSEEKGIHTLLEVCRKLPHIPFVFAGSGPLEEDVDRVSNVRNQGFLSGQELKRLVADARFAVFPSECYENCPFSVMEAQAYGTPVLGTNIGGTPELIQDMVNGELFPPGDGEELENKISGLWDNREKCLEYSRNCSTQTFDSLGEYCNKLIRIYEGKDI